MGARGPRPTPVQILKHRGTFRADRAPKNEAVPIGKPTCPSWLTDKDARKEFRRLASLLGRMGLTGAADGNLLARYSLSWVRYRRIVQALAANPSAEFMTFKDAAGKVKSVQVSALHTSARSLADELSRAEASLGMSPSARSRIEVSAALAGPAANAKSRFFEGLN